MALPPTRFVSLVYLLVRDELPAGRVERMIGQVARGDVGFADPELLAWAERQERRLPVYRLPGPPAVEDDDGA